MGWGDTMCTSRILNFAMWRYNLVSFAVTPLRQITNQKTQSKDLVIHIAATGARHLTNLASKATALALAVVKSVAKDVLYLNA